ncbi:MAG: hypothetical protein R3Y35_07400 [Clostridia bacterium]
MSNENQTQIVYEFNNRNFIVKAEYSKNSNETITDILINLMKSELISQE